MNRKLIRTNAFVRALRQFLKKRPHLTADVEAALTLLGEDAFASSLKTHKLKGELDGLWASSAGYDVRIVFEFVQHEGSEAILLLAIGTHDEVATSDAMARGRVAVNADSVQRGPDFDDSKCASFN